MTDTTAPPDVAEAGHPATSLGVPNEKMAIWAFLGSECLFFGALISAYLVYLGRYNGGPGPEIFDIPFTSVSTFVLLMSSLGMVLALSAIQHGQMRRFRTWTLATALMGSVFLAGQIFEFTEFYAHGMTLDASPWSSAFFVLTGFHGFHVAFGVMMLVSLWTSSMMGRLPQERSWVVENIGLYWHFVDIVWILIFTLVYLIPAE